MGGSFFLAARGSGMLKTQFFSNKLGEYQHGRYYQLPHTPPEGLCGSGKFTRLMTFTQLFFGISGTQNRKNQNFLTSPFFVIEILRYPTFLNTRTIFLTPIFSFFMTVFHFLTAFFATDSLRIKPHFEDNTCSLH